MATKKRWKDLSPKSRFRILALAAVQLGLQFIVLRDLARRPAELVNGAKGKWVALSFINFAGPLAYLLTGRRSKAQ
ncbi:hypothetical protein [Paeniglutamicibacter cryotolerans]|uniref:Cardiolipin synthase N-terminal domain-containing protein n=1 Tax=Paeniglutamicibacter cryotolerans TaxID=670079 RepID=A0A839QMK5_9MICC|nr:hypothetical protein [Paeniglutamicibacter cryotolerans]MBB2994442.1 hypothetical protein [Paeniglutamicibacter cryotolerans]